MAFCEFSVFCGSYLPEPTHPRRQISNAGQFYKSGMPRGRLRHLVRPGHRIGYVCSPGASQFAQAVWGLFTRVADAGKRTSAAAGRIGRATRFPAQLGQTPPSRPSAQSAQNVHSNVQMRAASLSGDRSRSQHSQLGLSSSIGSPTPRTPLRDPPPVPGATVANPRRQPSGGRPDRGTPDLAPSR